LLENDKLIFYTDKSAINEKVGATVMQHNPSKTRDIFLGRKNEACPHGGTRGNSNGAEDGPTPGPVRGDDFLGQLGRHTGDRRTAHYEAADHQHDRQEMGQNERPNKHKLRDRLLAPSAPSANRSAPIDTFGQQNLQKESTQPSACCFGS
jgi:hypothetical protein